VLCAGTLSTDSRFWPAECTGQCPGADRWRQLARCVASSPSGRTIRLWPLPGAAHQLIAERGGRHPRLARRATASVAARHGRCAKARIRNLSRSASVVRPPGSAFIRPGWSAVLKVLVWVPQQRQPAVQGWLTQLDALGESGSKSLVSSKPAAGVPGQRPRGLAAKSRRHAHRGADQGAGFSRSTIFELFGRTVQCRARGDAAYRRGAEFSHQQRGRPSDVRAHSTRPARECSRSGESSVLSTADLLQGQCILFERLLSVRHGRRSGSSRISRLRTLLTRRPRTLGCLGPDQKPCAESRYGRPRLACFWSSGAVTKNHIGVQAARQVPD